MNGQFTVNTGLFASCIVIFVVYLVNHTMAILFFALLLSNDPYTNFFLVRHKPRMSRKSASTFLAVIPLFDVDKHSAKHLRQFKYTCLTLIPSLLDSEDFVSKVSAKVVGWEVGSSAGGEGGGGS